MIREDYETMEHDGSEAYDGGESAREAVDEMLDALVDAADPEDFSERRRGGGRNNNRNRGRGVPTAQGRSAYRDPQSNGTGGAVTQKQLKDALDRVGTDVRRNAEGIKVINGRLNTIDSRVEGVVTVATKQGRDINRFEKQMKLDGALELVESLNNNQLNAFQLLKGAVMLGALGDAKGALGNPMVIGGLGLLLRNPGILGALGGNTAVRP